MGQRLLALVDLAVDPAEDNAPHPDAFYERQPYRSVIGAGFSSAAKGCRLTPEEVLPAAAVAAGLSWAWMRRLVEDQEEGRRPPLPRHGLLARQRDH